MFTKILCFRAAFTSSQINFVRLFSNHHYPVSPRLLTIDGYFKDSRQPGERQLRSTFEFQTKNGASRLLKIEIADEKDVSLMVQSCCELFIKEVNVYRHLKPTYDDFAQLFFDKKAAMISKGLSYIVKDEDKIVGFTMGDIHDSNDFSKIYTNGKPMNNPVFDIKNDYAEEINKAPYDSEKARKIYAFLYPAVTQTLRFVPSNVKRIFVYEATGIQKEYQKSNLYLNLVNLMYEAAKEKGCDYSTTYCLADASARQARKYCTHLFSFPYDQFKQNGNIVFPDRHDGAKAMEVFGIMV